MVCDLFGVILRLISMYSRLKTEARPIASHLRSILSLKTILPGERLSCSCILKSRSHLSAFCFKWEQRSETHTSQISLSQRRHSRLSGASRRGKVTFLLRVPLTFILISSLPHRLSITMVLRRLCEPVPSPSRTCHLQSHDNLKGLGLSFMIRVVCSHCRIILLQSISRAERAAAGSSPRK